MKHTSKCILASIMTLSAIASANAETVLFYENFDGDYVQSFPNIYDGDNKLPAYQIQAWFMSAEHGYFMPWWVLRESSADPDRFLGSHSYYYEPGQSDDWLISCPVTIPTTGFTLEFDAQSVCVRGDKRLSDLQVFVSEDIIARDNDAEPTMVCKDVPCGEVEDVTTDEWTRYTLSMDPWVGKTVYISFVNRNDDRDLLCLNNVKIYRNDAVEVEIEALPKYTFEASDEVTATITAVGETIGAWTLEFSNGTDVVTYSGDALEKGAVYTNSATMSNKNAELTEYTVTFTAEGKLPVVRTVSTTRLGFRTTHRVLLEETTGLWCSNCTRAIYSIEAMMHDENLSPYVVPVSVHTSGADNDLMVLDDYADALGYLNIAPMMRIDRQNAVFGISLIDSYYDPTAVGSLAHSVSSRVDVPALADIDVDAEWVIENGDTTAIIATATVRPAVSLDPVRYRVGFIISENNVGLDQHPYWKQENGLSGLPYESRIGGFCDLSSSIYDLRYHYVARAITRFGGLEDSFTDGLEYGDEYSVTFRIDIPDTYQEMSNGYILAPAIARQFCEVTAYLSDTEDLQIVNCARKRMSDEPYHLFSAADLVNKIEGIDDVTADNPDAPYYDLLGRPVTHPAPGFYIRSGRKYLLR